jgi:hypothetical protein
MNKVIIATGSIVGIAYITELFMAWYSGVEYERYAFMNRAMGPYAWAYWIMMTCNVISPQLLWFRKLRRSLAFHFCTFNIYKHRYVVRAVCDCSNFTAPRLSAIKLVDVQTYLG